MKKVRVLAICPDGMVYSMSQESSPTGQAAVFMH